MNKCAYAGGWLVLLDSHLWEQNVTLIFEQFRKIQEPHPSFKLWILTSPDFVWPSHVIGKCATCEIFTFIQAEESGNLLF